MNTKKIGPGHDTEPEALTTHSSLLANHQHSDKTDLPVTFPSVPAARKALARLRTEVRDAKTFQQLDMASRTAEAIQRAFRPVREGSHEAGQVWTAAVPPLREELAYGPKAK